MPRKKQPPRLYLDPTRQRWIIRYQQWSRRLPYGPDEKSKAEAVLQNILGAKSWAHDIRQLRPPARPVAVAPWARSETDGLIYFISAKENLYPIKIGFCSSGLDKRIGELQTGNPWRLVVLATTPGKHKHEQQIHARLAKDRLHGGEWFARSILVMQTLAAAEEGRLLDWLEAPFRAETVQTSEIIQ